MSKNYKDEFLPRLQKSALYQALKVKCGRKDHEVIALVDSAVSYAFQRTKTIIRHMGEFTLHDGDHLFRVLTLMEKLIPERTIRKLSEPELMLMILTAFFHDIGMAPDEKQVLAWRKVWDSLPELEEDEVKDFNDFKRFLSARPEQEEIINQLLSQGKHTQVDTIKGYLVTEFIRQTHAERAREIIEKDWDNRIVYRDADLTVEFAQICFSHNEDALALLDMEKDYLCAENTFACFPLIGVILRLADILDFDAKRTPHILYSHLYVRNPVSVKEWNKHRAVEAWDIRPDLIQFSAKCTHPVIEASIHEFCDLIDHELSVCNNVISILNDFNKNKDRDIAIRLPFKIGREKIVTKKDIHNQPLYIYRNTQFNLSKRQVVDLLMGTKLYGNPEVALRELLQNSIDACLLRQAQEKKWGNPYDPEIFVRYYSEYDEMILEVDDNGTGMDQYIIDNYYSKVGSSFYKSTDFYNLKAESNADFNPTSRFGIGILSCFMIADTLSVDTKKVYAQHKSSDALNITVEGQDSIFCIKAGKRKLPGTTTKLLLRKSKNPWDKMSEEEFIKSVENVIPRPPIKINIHTDSHRQTRDENSFKELTPDSLKDYTWDKNENIKIFKIPFDKKDKGVIGSALVAILESHGKPVEKVKLTSRRISIEDSNYTLEKKLWMSTNAISQDSSSITVNDDGNISQESGTVSLTKSMSRISLHGIEIPSSLFPEYWERKENQVKVTFPFPLILVVDVCGNRDLDLNSSRTEIIISEKWIDFEEELAFILCTELSKLVTRKYWSGLKNIFQKCKNENFLRGLNRLSI